MRVFDLEVTPHELFGVVEESMLGFGRQVKIGVVGMVAQRLERFVERGERGGQRAFLVG